MAQLRVFLLLAVLSVLMGLAGREPCFAKDADKMIFLDNGLIKIGVDLDRGGAIGFLADVHKGENIVNIHDLGRWIGQSYYSGPKPFGTAHPHWSGWPWNPVSAGDVYGHPSRMVEKKNDGKKLYIRSVPMQWALKNVPGDCQFETWISLEGRAVHVQNRLTNQRQDKKQYRARDQELPFIYTIGKLHRLMSYTGDVPFLNQSPRPPKRKGSDPLKSQKTKGSDPFLLGGLTEIPKKPAKGNPGPWSTFSATEHWAALVDDEDWGLGIIHPDVVRFIGGFHGKPNTGGPTDDPTGYIAPVRQEILDHNIVYDFHYTLVLDNLAGIRAEAYKQRPKENFPDYHFSQDRRHWWFLNAEDTGYPIKDHLRVKVEQNDPQMFGPESFWEAQEAPRMYIRTAYQTKNRTALLFWETHEKRGFPPDQSVKFTIIPDGKFRTYEVDLSACPSYRGKIRRLRFDPVETGGPGEYVDVEFISARK